MSYQLIHGSAHDTGLPAGSVHAVVTSPPYWGLRDYGKGQVVLWPAVRYSPMPGLPQIEIGSMDAALGLEPTIESFIGHLVLVLRELWRVLRDDGTCWINLGDSYSSDTKWGGQTSGKHVTELHGNSGIGRRRTNTGLRNKNLMGIPWRFAFVAQAEGWILRSDVIWHKPNPMPESVTDRPTKAHEYIFLLAKSDRYFYDAEAIKEPATYADDDRKGRANAEHKSAPTAEVNGIRPRTDKQRGHGRRHEGFNKRWDGMTKEEQCGGMRNKRDVWTMATRPYPGSHFATFPLELPELCIRASTSAHGVCPACSAPWRRCTEKEFVPQPDIKNPAKLLKASNKGLDQSNGWGDSPRDTNITTTTGWEPTCDCNAGEPIPATVLDLFNGSGTTGRAALALGRSYIGVDISQEYLQNLAPDRLSNIQMEMPL